MYEKIFTNLGKTKQQVIFELLLSLNQGNLYCADVQGNANQDRVSLAIHQYERLKDEKIIKEYESLVTCW